MLQTRNAKRPRAGGRARRGGHGGRGRADARRGAAAHRRRQARRAAAPDVRPELLLRAAGDAACRPRPGAAKGSDRVHRRRGGRAGRGRQGGDPRAAVHRGRGRRRASTRRAGSSPRRAARPRTRRWSRAAWAGRAWRARRELEIDLEARTVSVDGTRLEAGRPDRDRRHDGRGHDRGRAARGAGDQQALRHGARLGRRSCGGWACARTPTRPTTRARAREFGAEGIGLCRTEHMFMEADRQPKMRAMIMADDRGGAAGGARGAPAAPARRLRGHLRGDGGAARSRSGCSTRRCTSSSPSKSELLVERERLRRADDAERIAELEQAPRARARAGGGEPDARHARLPARRSCYPEIYEMQVRAIVGAALAVRERSRRGADRRDHDPAGRLRAGAGADARAGRARGRAHRRGCGRRSAAGVRSGR